ncbi:MAG: glycosyltransferase [Chloroflexota bacterium]
MLISDFFAPYLGGVELQVQALAKALTAEGHDVIVATVWSKGLSREEVIDGVRLVRLKSLATMVPWFSGDPDRRYHPPFPDPRVGFGLRQLARKFRPDIVQTHGWIAYSCALALTGTGIPIVLSVRDYGYACATRNLLIDGKICSGPDLRKCLRHAGRVYGPAKGIAAVTAVMGLRGWLARRTSLIHAVSGHVAAIVRRDVLRAPTDDPVIVIPDIVIIPNIVLERKVPATGPGSWAAIVEKDDLPPGPYILFVGALQPHKGLGPLLAAYRLLKNAPHLILIGTRWPDTPVLPDDITVLSNLEHGVVMAAWEGCLFGVAPSIWPDPLPGVVREAMSLGKAVVASRVGGIVDIIVDDRNGLLVAPDDVPELAAAMQRLVDDQALRDRLGAQAKADVQTYNPTNIAARYQDAYDQTRDLATGGTP